MKPILPYSILLSIAISPLALAASYTGGQILNKTITYDGIVKVSGSGTNANTGAVEVNINGRTTTLQGNVTVANTGVGGSGLFLYTGSGIVSSIKVNNVTSDVNVTTNGAGDGNGIYHQGNNVSNASKITIDAGSNYDLYVKKTGTSNSSVGVGVYADYGGKIDITAKNVNVDYTSSGQSWGVEARVNSIVNITTEKITAKGGWRGVEATNGGVINITGDLDASANRTADGIAVYAWGNDNTDTVLTVSGHTTVSGKAQYGVSAQTRGTVILKGGLTVNQATLGAAAAVYAYNGTVKDDVTNGADGATYNVSGRMRAYSTGTIDLHMGADSIFTGYTTKSAAADVIKLELSVSAEWALATANSSLTSLSVTQGSALTIASGNTFLITASAGITLGSGSYINMSDARADMDGTVLTLFNAASTVTDGTNVKVVGLVGDQWYSYDYTYSETTKKYTIGSDMTPIDVPEFRGGVTPIPEPTTASLTLLGLASLMMRRRRFTA